MTGSLNMNDHPVIGILSSAADNAALTVGGGGGGGGAKAIVHCKAN